ncbi:hypothetical protein KIH39_17895 [Telmatocola sphagniphila]|uniref:Uncharacterized protein n=1 Tax=Telmatocola sphagniphila TaxID=1123043 RepID=A0A8E6ETY7_9BACT|nr:hypothetical protein [Telmatocola sphagniphila]QVL30715.1 hypothetical protein KIH39_17895 [Telmatocola sphagniphila]
MKNDCGGESSETINLCIPPSITSVSVSVDGYKVIAFVNTLGDYEAFTIDWNDGSPPTNAGLVQIHTYPPMPRSYTITVTLSGCGSSVCTCDKYDRDLPWPEQKAWACKFCFLYHTRECLQGAWEVNPLDPPAAPESKPKRIALTQCDYLGKVIEKTDAGGFECSCQGKWLRKCRLHGECRLTQESDVPDCASCDDNTLLPKNRRS